MYIEYIFIENLIVNFFIILQLNKFLKENINLLRCFIPICLISSYTCIVVIFNNKFINNFFMQVTVIIICMYIIFLPNKIKDIIKETIYYYIMNFSFVGIVISLTLLLNCNILNMVQKLLIYLISYIVLDLVFDVLWKLFSFNIKNDKFAYKLNIKGYEISSYLDTGNNVTVDDKDSYVIFINKNHYKIINAICNLKKTVFINYSTILNMNNTIGYVVNNVDIYKDKNKICELKKCIFVFVDEKFMIDKYESLLGINLYIDKLKGV